MSKKDVKKAEVKVEETTEVKVDIKDTKTKVRDWFAKKGTQAKEGTDKAVKFVKRNAIPFGAGVVTGTVIAAKIMFAGANEEDFIDDAVEDDVDLNDDVNDLVTVGDVEEEDLEDESEDLED